jgi:sulfur carrier protein ThiS
MPAFIRPFGILKSYTGGQSDLPIAAGTSVRDALLALGIPPDIVAMVLVNDEQQRKDYLLQDGDIVKLIAVVGGG